MLIYLAGPITGLTFPVANAWRQKVRDALPPSVETLNPLRFDDPDQTENFIHRSPAFDGMKNVVRRNYHDVQRSDLILACFENCSPDNISIGSVYELGWAYSLRIPTIVVVPGLTEETTMAEARSMAQRPSTNYNHPYLKEAVDHLTDNLDEAIRIVRVLLPDSDFNAHSRYRG
jgi:nucleoside 2-deoxyribosyltransferase